MATIDAPDMPIDDCTEVADAVSLPSSISRERHVSRRYMRLREDVTRVIRTGDGRDTKQYLDSIVAEIAPEIFEEEGADGVIRTMIGARVFMKAVLSSVGSGDAFFRYGIVQPQESTRELVRRFHAELEEAIRNQA